MSIEMSQRHDNGFSCVNWEDEVMVLQYSEVKQDHPRMLSTNYFTYETT